MSKVVKTKPKAKAKAVPPKKPEMKSETKSEPKSNGNALYDFLLDQAGGKKAAMQAFATKRFSSLPKDMTLTEAIEEADCEGWGNILLEMPVGALRGSGRPSEPVKRRSRVSSQRAQESALEVLSAGVPMSTQEVAHAVDLDSQRVARALSALVRQGKVKREGSKRNSRYSLV